MDPKIIKKITGFDKAESIYADNNKHYLLAYCFRNGKTLSPWFVLDGTFDYCYGANLCIHEITYYNNDLGFIAKYYTILYELDDDNNPVKIINEIAYKRPFDKINKHHKILRDWLQIDEDLEPFIVKDYI